jgi:hypothetical protein
VPVREVFRGKTIWQGNVEVFDLDGHPKAKRAGWSHPEGEVGLRKDGSVNIEKGDWVWRYPQK